jgi:hypothetical protein
MKQLLVALTLAGTCLAMAAFAGEEDQSSEMSSDKPTALKKLVRQDSLELPGLTACHQCEWRPKPHQMAAQDQCGMTPDGHPKVGVYECGFSQDCQRVCNFVRCAD